MKLIHISDIHFALDHMTVWDMIRADGLFSKRILGWINYQLNRRDQYAYSIRQRLFDYLIQTDWDYLVMSGDFTNLSLEAEFIEARHWFEPLIEKGTVLLTAGNHDRYVPEAVNPDLMKKYFSDCFPFNKDNIASETNCIELSESAVLFEIEMSIPRKLFSSRGKIRSDLNAYRQLIEQRYRNHCKIVMGHYPATLPPEINDICLHELAGKSSLSKFLNDNHIDLYLHGHIHKTWQHKTTEGHSTVHLNSGGCFKHRDGPWAGFHEITLKDNAFTIQKITI